MQRRLSWKWYLRRVWRAVIRTDARVAGNLLESFTLWKVSGAAMETPKEKVVQRIESRDW
jgi:hypothetical protein